MFSPFVQERLGHYVYLLIDPRDGAVFYVGKGVGNRVFAHAGDALEVGSETSSDKLDRIRAIHGEGRAVRHELLRFGLTSSAAFEVEAAAIQLLGLDELTNIVAGHHIGERGRMTTDVAISMFDAPPVESISEPVLLIRIPKRWYPTMPADELLDATAGWWRLGERRNGARYAFAVNRGVIREVYEIRSWRQRVQGDRGWEQDVGQRQARWGFDGLVVDDLGHYRNRSVAHLFQQGDQSPIKYINC